MTVPKKPIIVGVSTLLVGGVSFTLAHHSNGNQAAHANSGVEVQTGQAAADAQGVAENPPVSISVDGKALPLKQGTTTVPTDRGSATVSVSGNDVNVNQTSSSQGQGSSGSLNVSVQSTNSSGSHSSASFQHTTSTSTNSSSSSSHTSVFSSGGGSVTIQNNQ